MRRLLSTRMSSLPCLKQDLQDEQDVPDEKALVNANVLFTVARGTGPREP